MLMLKESEVEKVMFCIFNRTKLQRGESVIFFKNKVLVKYNIGLKTLLQQSIPDQFINSNELLENLILVTNSKRL